MNAYEEGSACKIQLRFVCQAFDELDCQPNCKHYRREMNAKHPKSKTRECVYLAHNICTSKDAFAGILEVFGRG